MIEPDQELVKLPAAAKFLHMCPRSVGEKARKGIIPSVKIGGSRLFSLKVLAEWIERGMANGQHSQ